MQRQTSAFRGPSSGILRAILAVMAFVCLASAATGAHARSNGKNTLEGVVEGNGAEQPGYHVSLYASYSKGSPFKRLLGKDTTNGAGEFKINYKLPPGLSKNDKPVLYILAEDGPAMLASAVGDLSKNHSVVVNELTTVAIGTAFAQFIDVHVSRTGSGPPMPHMRR